MNLQPGPAQPKTALVTGATGFIGGHLARRLHAAGWAVTATGRSTTKGRALTAAGIRFFPIDLVNRAGIVELCKDQAVVFHCGARSSAWGALDDFRLSNVTGTANVIAGCQTHHVPRLVHLSTPSIYFDTGSRLNVAEDDRLPERPINSYALTKREAEGLVDQAVADGLSAIIVRPRAVYGPGDQSLLPRIMRALAAGRMPIIGRGTNIQNLTYIDNLIDALLLCAGADSRLSGRKYNVTDGEPVKIWEVIFELAAKLGYPPPQRQLSFRTALALATALEGFHRAFRPGVEPMLTRYGVTVLSQSQTLDISAIQADLGYQARVGLEEGLSATVTWWREAGGLVSQ